MKKEQTEQDIYKGIAQKIEGKYSEDNESITALKGNTCQRSVIKTVYKNWNIYFLATYKGGSSGGSVLYSGVYVPVNFYNRINCKINEKDILDKLNFLSSSVVKTGDRSFDKNFYINSNEKEIIGSLLSHEPVKEIIRNHIKAPMQFEIKENHFFKNIPEKDVLCFQTNIWIIDEELILKLHEAIKVILERVFSNGLIRK
ncbi:hypothetical protein ACFLTI_07940 [Bacteroidota bacterium]